MEYFKYLRWRSNLSNTIKRRTWFWLSSPILYWLLKEKIVFFFQSFWNLITITKNHPYYWKRIASNRYRYIYFDFKLFSKIEKEKSKLWSNHIEIKFRFFYLNSSNSNFPAIKMIESPCTCKNFYSLTITIAFFVVKNHGKKKKEHTLK